MSKEVCFLKEEGLLFMLVYEHSHEYHRKKKVHYPKITTFFKAHPKQTHHFFDFHLSMGTSFDRACKAESTSKFW